LGMRPVTDIPKHAMNGERGRNHRVGRLSERCPNAGWTMEDVRFAERRMTPDVVYERLRASLKIGRRAGKAPWLISVTIWLALRMPSAFLFIFSLPISDSPAVPGHRKVLQAGRISSRMSDQPMMLSHRKE
jgi:hypothetical protein